MAERARVELGGGGGRSRRVWIEVAGLPVGPAMVAPLPPPAPPVVVVPVHRSTSEG